MATKPFPYQREGVRRITEFGGVALLADEMGLGKSLQALRYAWINDDLRPVLIVCPASLKWNWEREAAHHFNLRAQVLSGRRVPARQPLAVPEIIVVNYDILPQWIDYLEALKPKLIIVDECHYVRNRKTLRYKMVRRLARRVKKKIFLSGTPLTNRPAELWPILNLLRRDLYPSFHSFAVKHCAPQLKPWGWEYKGAVRLKELHRNLGQQLMVRRLKRDVIKQLPAKTHTILPLELSKRKEYDHAVKDFAGWLAKNHRGKLTRALRAERLVKMGYLRRLAAELKMPQVLNWIDDFFENNDGKLITFGVHKSILKVVREKHEKKMVFVDGSVTGRDRQHAVDKFQKDRRTKLFVGNIQAAGVGLNLTAAHSVAFIEFPWTPAELSQAADRAYARVSDMHGADIFYLVARGTIEEDLLELLQKKQRILDKVLDGKFKGHDFDIHDRLVEKLLEKK